MKISVIMPVYNEEKYLSEAIESFELQSLSDKELICIDDGSTDNSVSIIKEYAEEYGNIVLLQQDRQGAGAARNFGLGKAQGEYVCFLDADDVYIDNTALEKLYNEAKISNVYICAGLLQIIKKEGIHNNSVLRDLLNGEKTQIIEYEEFQYDYQYQCYIFGRKFLEENRIVFPSFLRFQDPPFLVQALYYAEKFKVVDVEFYGYRFGFKLVEYKKEKVNGLFKGLLYNLKFSYEHKLEKLFNLTIKRINQEYFNVLYNGLNIENVELLGLMFEAYEFAREMGKEIEPLNALLVLKGEYKQDIYNEYRWVQKIQSIMPSAKRIVLYGAGNMGKKYQYYIEKYNIFESYIWVDKYKVGDVINGTIIMDTKCIQAFHYDYILVSVLDKELQCEIEKELKQNQISEKILMLEEI